MTSSTNAPIIKTVSANNKISTTRKTLSKSSIDIPQFTSIFCRLFNEGNTRKDSIKIVLITHPFLEIFLSETFRLLPDELNWNRSYFMPAIVL